MKEELLKNLPALEAGRTLVSACIYKNFSASELGACVKVQGERGNEVSQ